MFEISIDCGKISYPYGDISKLSQFSNEFEILFMAGTAFHITDNVVYNETEKLWLIKLELEEDKRKVTYDDYFSITNSNVSIRISLKRAVRSLLQRFSEISADNIYNIFGKII